MRRALATAMVVVLAVLLVAPTLAPAQSGERQGVPEELWREYPLREQKTAPAPSPREPGAQEPGQSPGADEPADRPAGEAASGDDSEGGSGGMLAFIGLVLLAIAVAAGVGVGLPRARRRRESSAAGGGGERARPRDTKRRARAVRPGAAESVSGKPRAQAPKPSPARKPLLAPGPSAGKSPEPAPKPSPAREPEPAPEASAGKLPEPAPEPSPAKEPERAPEPSPAKPSPAKEPRTVAKPPAEKARPPALEPDRSLRAGPPRTRTLGETPSAPGSGARPSKVRAHGAAADRSSAYALGYTTVAEHEKPESPRMQQEAHQIRRACRERGLVLRKLVRDVDSPSRPDLERPGLLYALERLDNRSCSCLVVTRLDRLTRSAANLGTLIQALEKRRARLVVTEIGLDTASREGLLAARALVKVGNLEQKKLEQQTRKGLAAAREGGSARPAVADQPDLKRRIASMRSGGMTLQAIADTLNREGVPTLRGGAEWRPSSVQAAAGYKRPGRKSRAEPDNGHGPGR